jgi:hypothetical protein
MPSIEKIKEKLDDFNVLLKHMDFLQNNGFSDFGRGHIVGQIELLEEYLSEARENQGEASAVGPPLVVVEMESDKSRNIMETMVVADKSKGGQGEEEEEEQGRGRGSSSHKRMVADSTYEKGEITISKEDDGNRTANNNTNYSNGSNPDLAVRLGQQSVNAEYSKKLDANNNIMNNNEFPSQKDDQIAQVLCSSSSNKTIRVNEDNNNYGKDIVDITDNNNYIKPKIKEVQDLNRQDNKVTKQSWRDKIKDMANNIEDWR